MTNTAALSEYEIERGKPMPDKKLDIELDLTEIFK